MKKRLRADGLNELRLPDVQKKKKIGGIRKTPFIYMILDIIQATFLTHA